jgi:hypothetical protein
MALKLAAQAVFRKCQKAYAVAPAFPTATYPKPLLTKAFIVDVPVLIALDQVKPFGLV